MPQLPSSSPFFSFHDCHCQSLSILDGTESDIAMESSSAREKTGPKHSPQILLSSRDANQLYNHSHSLNKGKEVPEDLQYY